MSFHRILRSRVVGFYAINGRKSWAGISAGEAFQRAFNWWLFVIGEGPYSLYEQLKRWEGGTGEYPDLKTLRRWSEGPIEYVKWSSFELFVPFMWEVSFKLRERMPLMEHDVPIHGTQNSESWVVPDPRYWIPGRLLPTPWDVEPKPEPHACVHDETLYCLWCWPYAPYPFEGPGVMADPPGAVVEVLAAFAALQLKHIPFDEKEFGRRISRCRSLRDTDDFFGVLQVTADDLVLVLRQKGWVEWCSYPKKPPVKQMFGRTKLTRGNPEPFFWDGADRRQWNTVGYALDNPDEWKAIREAIDEAEPPDSNPNGGGKVDGDDD